VSKACDFKLNQKVFFLHLGEAASCCRAHHQDLTQTSLPKLIQFWEQEKQDLEKGKEILGCEHCWQDEHRGIVSFREMHQGKNHNSLELYLSNTCNHMCSYCSPKYSSKWQNIIQTQGMFQRISSTNQRNLAIPTLIPTQDRLIEIRDYIQQQPDDSVSLKLLGGEPLMQMGNLDLLLLMDSPKIHKISIVTNLNPPNNRFLRRLLDHAHKLHIHISLDATPDYNHVPRAGFDPIRFYRNLELLESKQVAYNIQSVVSVLSVFDLPAFLIWLRQKSATHIFERLYNPDCLDAALLPRWLRQTIWDQIDHDSPVLQEVLNSQNESVDIKRFEQYNYLTQYFQRSQQDPKKINNDLFQEYWTELEGTYRK